MADRELRLRVGAALDASFNSVMATVVENAKRARKQIAGEMRGAARESAQGQKEANKEVETSIKSTAKTAKQEADKMSKDVLRSARAAAREKVSIEKAAVKETNAFYKQMATDNINRANAELAHRKKVAADYMRMLKAQGAQERYLKNLHGSENKPSGLSRGGALFARAGASMIGSTMQMASSAMHGMGIDTGITSTLHGSVHRQAQAIDLSSQGYIGSGKGPHGSNKYTDPNELLAEAYKVGSETGTKAEDILGGGNKFVKMTGDLETARSIMKEIGIISKANAADFTEMMEASANISIAMGEVPNKAEALSAIMRTLAGQGHLGAVSLSDQAKQIGKLTAQANFFKIDPMTAATLSKAGVNDEVAQRVAVMGAMQQWTRAKGGRVSANQASQSSMAFMRDLANPTEIKRMHEQGIQVYADAGHTKVRDPLQIMLEVFRSKKAHQVGGVNRDVINRVFTNQQSRATANAMSMTYNEKYKEAVEKGITDETKRHQYALEEFTGVFQNFMAVTQNSQEVMLKFNKGMEGAESQANIMNNKFGAVSDELMHVLLPAIKEFTAALVPAAQGIVNFLGEAMGTKPSKEVTDVLGVSLRGTNALSTISHTVNDAQRPGRKVWDFINQDWMEEKTTGKISTSEEKEARDTAKLLEAEIAKKRKAMHDRNTGPSSWMLGDNSKVSDEKLEWMAGHGNQAAQQELEDRKQVEQLRDTLDKLKTNLDKFDVLRGAGKIEYTASNPMPVAIVKDHTDVPTVQPHTDGVEDPNSMTSHQ